MIGVLVLTLVIVALVSLIALVDYLRERELRSFEEGWSIGFAEARAMWVKTEHRWSSAQARRGSGKGPDTTSN